LANEMLTNCYREYEIQALIALDELSSPLDNPNDAPHIHSPKNMQEALTYFRRFAQDLSNTFPVLKIKGLVCEDNGTWALTQAGRSVADELRILRPPIYYWYCDFYSAVENSQAFDEYSKRVFGANFGQHGFSDIKQIRRMLTILKLNSSSSVLDIGCGNGKMAEYISDLTQASITGIDYVQEAINQAVKRTDVKRDRLHFQIANLEFLDFSGESFDAIISIDTIFFGRNMENTIAGLKRILKPDGKIAVFNGDFQNEEFHCALAANQLIYDIYDLTQEHIEHMLLKHSVAKGLKNAFEVEGNSFIWQNLMAESFAALDSLQKTDFNPKVRYLYIVKNTE
jgi:ubiquinone/menaquinone biosynthesis C-methylase UbiE